MLAVLSLTLACSAGGAAEACRVNQPPEACVAHAYDAVILARIESAGPDDRLRGERPAWTASARRTGAIEGKAVSQAVFEIGRTGQSTACDDGQPIARVGETWVLYLHETPGAGWTAGASYPLDLARRIDPRLSRLAP
ncbi:hypothetical protein [Caulobacter endophyticus]|uniref:Uncharacterized protein n=1 Tax=Caulobacter endophyticus TaxID=2172652 RepID=A0A2T9JQ43_9CAUL|nr:hypothetical protein [Caulobacter endophyticus]PVM85813.1 hypothetical protein DDF67_16575 [Caulobacter endophyticus]